MKNRYLIALLGVFACTVASAQLASEQPVTARPAAATATVPAGQAAPLASAQSAPARAAAAAATPGGAATLASSQPAPASNGAGKRAVVGAAASAAPSAIGAPTNTVSADASTAATAKKQ